jgi:uncharacterized protein (TIGR03435 family)
MKILLLLSMIAIVSYAQTPAFEAASIKPNRSLGGVSSIRPSTGRISMENVSLEKLILNAYGIPDDRKYALSGPNWLKTESFDIEATFPADTPLPQVRKMLQRLLAERFGLTLHRETRQLPVLALMVSKNGPKIHAVADGQPQTSGGPGRLQATRITMVKLSELLSRAEGLPVVDSTGLTGVFDFTLEWSPEEVPTADAAAGAPGTSLFAALQDQLGLRLEARKGPVEVLVVDHLEKTPTEN